MMLYLQELAKHGQNTKELTLNERLPDYLISPCHVTVDYQVEAKDDYYLIHSRVVGDLNIICQRCMHEFTFHYENPTSIAVCRDDDRAENLLELYESIISKNGQVNLDDLVIDELHLYAPLFHPVVNDCDKDFTKLITSQNESND